MPDFIPEDAHLDAEYEARHEFESDHEDFGDYEDIGPDIYNDNGEDF